MSSINPVAFASEYPNNSSNNTPGTTNTPRSASIKICPKNWKSMLGIDGSLNPTIDNDMFLKFICYSPPSVNYFEIGKNNIYDFNTMKILDSYKFLCPAEGIEEKIEHTYGAGSIIQQAMGAIRSTGAGLVNSLVSLGSSTNGILIENPEFYNNSKKREFEIKLNLFGYSDLDSDIYAPIRFFRNNSYPKVVNGPLIQFPNVFKIRGGAFRTNQDMKDTYFALKGMSIGYNDKIPYFKKGYPMQVSLSLNFMELVQMYSDKFNTSSVQVKVGRLETGKVTEINDIASNMLDRPELASQASTYDDTNDLAVSAQENRAQQANDLALAKSKTPPSFIASKAQALATNISQQAQKTISNLVANSAIVRRVENIGDTLENLARSKISAILAKSPLYHTITDLTQIDPVHEYEVKQILKRIRH